MPAACFREIFAGCVRIMKGAGFLIGLVSMPFALHASGAATIAFDLPVDAAEKALKLFSKQSGLEVLFSTETAANVRTNAVRGDFTAREALDRMLAGTNLVALQDEKAVGAVRVIRRSVPNGGKPAQPGAARGDRSVRNDATLKSSNLLIRAARTIAASTALLAVFTTNAQTSSNLPAKDGKEDEPLLLNPFEITMTQDRGYTAPNSGMALRTNEEIIKIPQSVTVITRDMIDDIGSGNTSDTLNYVGASNIFQGDSASLRGVRVNMLVDGVQDLNFFDPVVVDSYTVVRGPTAVLYGQQTSLGGAIIKNTRVPTGRKATNLSLQADQWGYLRAELDHTSPIAKAGETQFAYRVAAAHQEGQNYLKNTANDRDVVYLMTQMRNRSTTLRLAFAATEWRYSPTRTIFMTPEGIPYAGAGRREDYQPRGTIIKRDDASYRLILLHSFTPNWNMSLRATTGRNNQLQPIMLTSRADFQTNEALFFTRRNQLHQRFYAGSYEVNGKYKLFNLPMTSNFGFLVNDNINNPSFFPIDPTFGTDNATSGVGFRAFSANTLAVPMDNPQAHKIVVRPGAEYPGLFPTTAGTRSESIQTNVYVQQNVELFKERLILVGSLAQFNHFSESENIVAPTPPSITATIARQNDLLHRIGLVYLITPHIGIYALDSRAMNPQTSRLIDGTVTPPQAGKGLEIGLKLGLLDNRITATMSVFDIKLTNVAVTAVGPSPITGQPYVTLIGATKQRGADLSLAVKPLPTLQLTFNAYKGSVKDQYNRGMLANTFTGALAIYGRYGFTSEPLKKFAVGGGANRLFGRYVAASGIRLRDGSIPPTNGSPGAANVLRLKDGTMTQLFIDYFATKRLLLKLSVNNVLDEFFVAGFQSAVVIDPTLPRTVSLYARYRF